VDVSAISCGAMNPSKNGSTASMTDVSSLTIMRVAFSSVNSSSKVKPIAEKNSVALARSFTGRLMNVCIAIVRSLLPLADLLY
jgi:hypothetical protein